MALEAEGEADRAQADGKQAQEQQAAREILAEVFGARPGKVEEMIKRRLEESEPEEREVGDVLSGGVDM